MARVERGNNGGRCSYKRTTLVVCSINIVVALYVIHSLYISLYIYPLTDFESTFKYSPDQIKKMEESNQIRKASEPTELIKVVTMFERNFLRGGKVVELPQHLKQKLIDEILDRLKTLGTTANATDRREAVETWRKEKLEEARKLVYDKTLNSTLLHEEMGVLVRALSTYWPELSEDIGLWLPVEVINNEHDDKPDGEDEFDSDMLPGRQLPPECRTELHTDYDGAAVRWGLTNPKESAYDCCMQCLDQAKRAKLGEMKCNIWVYCPSETGCHSTDMYEHKNQECWLKYAEKPRVTFKDMYSESHRAAHPNAPLVVPWVAGVVGYCNRQRCQIRPPAPTRSISLEYLGCLMAEEGDGGFELSYCCRYGDYYSVDSSELAEMGYSFSGKGVKFL